MYSQIIEREIPCGKNGQVGPDKMSETIHVERKGQTPIKAVEIVESPADGGYYLGETDFSCSKRRVSVEIYRTANAARAAWKSGAVEWE